MDYLARHVQERPHQTAIVGPDGQLTFAELEDEVGQAAALLRDAGLREGESALMVVPVSVTLYVALLAVWRLGGVVLLVDPAAGRTHLERSCELYPPDMLIASGKGHLLRVVSKSVRRIPAKVTVGRWPVPGAVRWSRRSRFEPLPNAPVDPEKPALLTFTSGSTGRPKAAVRTHGFLAEQHRVLERHLALHPGEPALVTLPVFALAHLASGQPTIIADADLRRPGYIDPEPVFRQINRWHPTRIAASPAFFERLIEYAERTGTPLPVAGALYTGGAPVYPDVLDRLARAAPQATVEAVYGSTEAEPIAHVAHAEISEADRDAMQHGAGLLTGRPVEDIDVRILQAKPGEPLGHLTQEAFEERTQPAEGAGEIVVSGAHVLKHYWQGHGEAETKFDVGETRWHRTGDIGRLDDAGRLWLLGRATAVLHDEHGAVYPFAVEVAASALPGVQRAALAAVGSRRVLAVEIQPGFDAKSVQEQLAWARLDEVRPVRQIPLDRRHNAKVDYPALKEVLET